MIATISGPRGLRLARIVTFILITLILTMYIAALGTHYQMLQQLCTAQKEVCQQNLTQLMPEELASLQLSGLSLSAYAALQVLKLFVFASIWFGVGGLILFRTPDQWMALVAGFTLITFPTGFDSVRDTLVQAYPVLELYVHIIGYLISLSFPLFIALFPNGHWSPPWTRWVIILYALLTLPEYFAPGWLTSPSLSVKIILMAQLTQSLGVFILLFAAQVIRYRRFSTPLERLQARWVIFGVGAGIGLVAGLFFVWLTGALPTTGWLARFASQIAYQSAVVLIPVSVAIAILRYHLFDIDIIIRRTLVYAILTALLGLVYYGGVVVLQSVLTADRGQPSAIVIVLTTLAIAALFKPLRRRIQDFIDRGFYRRKYDAEKALAKFASAARSETEMQMLTHRLVAVVQETVQPERVSLWLKPAKKAAGPGQEAAPARSQEL